jgi:hypothetical protein
MTDAVVSQPNSIPKFEEQRRKPARKSQPAQFPHRITFCMADDQVQTLAAAKKIYRATESFMLRLAWDQWCRANHLTTGDLPNGR